MSKFASKGVVVGQTRRSRREQKSDNISGVSVTMGKNIPRQNEGKVGDITVREIRTVGLRIYVKTESGWYDINAMSPQASTIWIKMNLTGNWTHDTAYSEPAYFKDSNGFVHLRGGLVNASGSATDDIFTLPAGYRPTKTILVAGARASSRLSVKITLGGVINFINGGATGSTENFIDGISFYASQPKQSTSSSLPGDHSSQGTTT